MESVSRHEVPAAPAPQGAQGPMGRYGPQVSITRFDTAPRELEWQLPLEGELYRLIPGPDRPDYSLLVLERPLHFYPTAGFDLGRVEADQRVEDRKGRPMVRVHALLVCARFVGQQLRPGMRDLAVNVAYVIDNSLARDAVVDFSKIEVAAVGFLSEGHAAPNAPTAPTAAVPAADSQGTDPETAEPESAAPASAGPEPELAEAAVGRDNGESAEDVVARAARVLRDGVAANLGRRVERLTATLVVGPDGRLTGLSGNADGEPPVPAPETFSLVNEILEQLEPADEQDRADEGEAPSQRRFTVRVEGDTVTHEHVADASA